MFQDDFKNFLIIKKIEEDKKGKTFWSSLFQYRWVIFSLLVIIFALLFLYKVFFSQINLIDQKDKNLFRIDNGESIAYIGKRLKDGGVIDSALAFKIYIKVFSGNTTAQAGVYALDPKDTLISVANKIIKADYAIPPVKITIPEGSNNLAIAKIISKGFVNEINSAQLVDDFSIENILEKIKNKEGYLFPDTYVFLPNTTLDYVIKEMSDHFYKNLRDLFVNKRVALGIYSLQLQEFPISDFFYDDTETINLTKRFTIINSIGTTTVTMKDVINMASYLEGEANNKKDMQMVSGVLWTRLKLNYPLQIDAATSTYKEKGFTKAPINNPGMTAIISAINPLNTGNIYYITGNDGVTYYAKDYQNHLKNINKYLRK